MKSIQILGNVITGNKVIKYLPVLMISLLSLVFIAGCSDDSSNPVGGDPNSPSKVQGKATDNNGFQKSNGTNSNIEGATVILARVKADGSLETVSNASVQTDVSGLYTVETNVDGESNLLVVATKGSNVWKAVVSSTVKNGITVFAPPLNDETTVEAEVYASVKASGNANVTFADIASTINIEIAVQVKGDASAMADLTASIEAEADAKVQTFTSSEVGGTLAEWQLIVNAKAQAQAQLERDLFVASSQSEINAAFETYTDATINAYNNAGSDITAYGKVIEASSRVFINNATSISSSVKFAVQKRIALLKAKIINFVVLAKFTALGASQAQMNTIISAAATLNASIDASATFSAILIAFDDYHTAVVNELSITLGVDSSTMAAIESNIAAFQATLESSVKLTVSTNVIVNAYMKFYSDVKSSVEGSLSTLSQTQVNATVQILLLLNVQF